MKSGCTMCTWSRPGGAAAIITCQHFVSIYLENEEHNLLQEIWPFCSRIAAKCWPEQTQELNQKQQIFNYNDANILYPALKPVCQDTTSLRTVHSIDQGRMVVAWMIYVEKPTNPFKSQSEKVFSDINKTIII